MMMPAQRKGKELIDDILSCEASEDLHIWWLGQSGYLLQFQGKRILLDPYLSDSLTKKYAGTDKPHVRISELVVTPELLPRIDLITSSHNHTDHLDAETLIPLLQQYPKCKLLIPEANRNFVAERLHLPASLFIGLNDGEEYNQAPFCVKALPAAHNKIERDEEGKCKYLGYFVTVGPYRIYHSGDTLHYEGMEEIIKTFSPHVAILPINGNLPERKVAGNLNAKEAIKLAKSCGIPYVIPCHYDLFAFNTADINEFMTIAKSTAQPYLVLNPGGKCCGRELINSFNPLLP
jgi:L-ascorbate metabolism protein UlaG (beta-lactamase superfamily)